MKTTQDNNPLEKNETLFRYFVSCVATVMYGIRTFPPHYHQVNTGIS